MQLLWQQKAETKEPSIINGLIWQARTIPEFIKKLYQVEDICLIQPYNLSKSDLVMLWVLLGAIQEALLKIHIIVFRNKYTVKFGDYIDKIDNKKVKDIIREMVAIKDITDDERVVLETINSNRNMIHFISTRPIHNYEKYYFAVEDLIKILEKLFIMQTGFLNS